MTIRIQIGDTQGDEWVSFPDDLEAWAARIKKSLRDYGCMEMQIDTLGSGGHCTSISFGPFEDHDGFADLDGKRTFGFNVPRETLRELRDAFGFAVVAAPPSRRPRDDVERTLDGIESQIDSLQADAESNP